MVPERTVYIIDDDVIIRRSLGIMLRELGYSARPFASGDDFIEALSYLTPGCVLLDVHMPGMSGMEVQEHLGDQPSFPLLMMTAAGDIPMAVRAIKGGAVDFIEKPFADRLLLSMLDRIFVGLEHYMEQNEQHEDALARIDTLSTREREVAAGLMAGLPNKLIAFELGLGIRTIESHRANMMRKLRVRSVGEVVKIGIEARLEPLHPEVSAAAS
jgi:two-component system response regulator FixJ